MKKISEIILLLSLICYNLVGQTIECNLLNLEHMRVYMYIEFVVVVVVKNINVNWVIYVHTQTYIVFLCILEIVPIWNLLNQLVFVYIYIYCLVNT